MILELFGILLAAAFVLLYYGFYVRSDLFRIIGAVLLFLFGGMFSPSIPSLIGTLQYENGLVAQTVGNITTTTYQYATYTNHTLGFYFAILGIFAFIVIMVDRRSD